MLIRTATTRSNCRDDLLFANARRVRCAGSGPTLRHMSSGETADIGTCLRPVSEFWSSAVRQNC